MKEASENDVKNHKRSETGTGCLYTGLGFGLLCVIVGIVAIAGMEEHQFGRPSRELMSQILRFLGGALGNTGGVICIVVGVILAIAGIAVFLRSRSKSS